MAETVIKGYIRKITIGTDPLNNGKCYALGTYMKGLDITVVDIRLNKNFLIKYGMLQYHVLARDEKTKNVFLWHEVTNMPVDVEHSKPGEIPENVE